jgi:hypothetical protein
MLGRCRGRRGFIGIDALDPMLVLRAVDFEFHFLADFTI